MEIFTCEDQFESMMTCIYDAWASKAGHSNLRLMLEPVLQPELFCSYHHVEADPWKAEKVVRSVRNKISRLAYEMVYGAAMSCRKEKLDAIYRFLVLGFHVGPKVTDFLGEDCVNTVFCLDRRTKNEAHHFQEFIRFSSISGGKVLWAGIRPECDVLTLLAPHFEDRMPSEAWMIVDEGRRRAVVHPPEEAFYLTAVTEEELCFMKGSREKTDPYVGLWKSFFQAVGIEQRKNPRCQRNLFPLRYRTDVTEFEKT